MLRADLGSIGDDLAFEVESPASDYAIAVVVSQGGGPVAFMPRSWNECEKYDRIIEKKPLPLKPFENGHFTKGRSFTLSDQRSVSFMFDKTNHGKVNDQILLWSLELSQFGYEM